MKSGHLCVLMAPCGWVPGNSRRTAEVQFSFRGGTSGQGHGCGGSLEPRGARPEHLCLPSPTYCWTPGVLIPGAASASRRGAQESPGWATELRGPACPGAVHRPLGLGLTCPCLPWACEALGCRAGQVTSHYPEADPTLLCMGWGHPPWAQEEASTAS